jgi:choline-sulfatase
MPGRALLSLLLLVSVFWASGGCGSSPARRSMILITVDTLRPDHAVLEVAPALARLASEAMVFETAISVGPLTLPAHASLFTGQVPPTHGVRDNHLFSLDRGTATYPAAVRSRGYDTAAFVSAVVLDRRYGLDSGFDLYDDAMPAQSPERSARDTLSRAEAWLASRDSAAPKPFFLWIHLFEPHAPYTTGSYAGEVTDVDRELGRFFNVLRARGQWDQTVISVTSDHGESLGEHGEDTHGFFIYDSTIRIPWLLKAPALAPGRFAPQVRLLDVMPTMVALAEVSEGTAPLLEQVEGMDLSTHLARDIDPGLDAYTETLLPKHQFNWSELKSIRTASVKYIDAPEPELYRWQSDPAETRNLAASEPVLVSRMEAIVARASAAAAEAPRREFSDVVESEKFLALGYIGQAHTPSSTGTIARADPKRKVGIYRLVMSALTLSESGRPEEALAALRRAGELEPNLTQVQYLRGLILGGQERYREAASALERAVELNPRHVLARFKLALAYLRLGATEKAESVLQAVIADEPRNMRAYQNLAALAFTRGDIARAESLARRAIEIDRTYFDPWNTLGAIYIVAERPSEAVEALTTAIALNPESGQAQYNLSLALRARGDVQAAAAAEKQACALDKQYCM